ncbi:MAG: hypothetical protein SPI72_01150 [Porphyromonas sp.]|nr:hypothetical protein [Porphyromonas sp.]
MRYTITNIREQKGGKAVLQLTDERGEEYAINTTVESLKVLANILQKTTLKHVNIDSLQLRLWRAARLIKRKRLLLDIPPRKTSISHQRLYLLESGKSTTANTALTVAIATGIPLYLESPDISDRVEYI